MAEFSKRLLDMLSEFMVRELGSKVLDGVTYTFVFNTEADKQTYEEYMAIKQEATNCGYTNDEVFRTYKLSNGYIFDMDLNTAKQITTEVYKRVAKDNNMSTDESQNSNFDLIKDNPENRRKRDIVGLARYLKSEFDKGNKQVEVALFSRNSSNKIIINGKLPNGNPVSLRYNAYILRHWDIEILNEKFLIPAGFRVKRIQPLEILPSKTGASFLITMESMNEFREICK